MRQRQRWSLWLRAVLLLLLGLGLLQPGCGKPEGYCDKNGDCTNLAQECAKNKCEDIKCSKDGDCRSGWFCKQDTRKCVKDKPVECKEDSDCTNAQKCEDGKCVAKPECAADGDCNDAKKECKDGKCVDRACKEDLDCGDNTKYECKDGACVERKIECDKNEDCKDSAKPVCKDNKCVEKQGCDSNDDCKDPAKPLCVTKQCVADSGGKEGEACDTAKKDCKSGLICAAKEAGKTEGTCRSSCLTYSPKCDSGKVCRQLEGPSGACVDSNGGKKAGEECSDTDVCDLNLQCVTWKGKKICAKPCDKSSPSCASGEECYEAFPKKDLCVSEREPCGPGRPCDTNFTCVGGRCNPPPSCEGIKCKDDELCENGSCRAKKCPDERRCPAGEQCDTSTGKCGVNTGDPPCKPCANSDPRCPNSTDSCITGLGNPNEAFCFEDCTNGTCTDTTNFTCRTINLQNNRTCTSDAQCGGGGFTCNSGQCTRAAKLCVPKIGTCRNKCKNVTCASTEVCDPTQGTCVTTGKKLCDKCGSALECGTADDLCVNYGPAGSFCGQDCRTKPCPTGYQCFNLADGVNKQCAPPGLMCPP